MIALGNPYAIVRDGSVSASWGLVSNRRAKPARTAEPVAPRTETLHQHGGLIETDARLKLGTSGGPLINLRGEMVGLLTSTAAIFGYDVAASYAIPVDAGFRRVLEQLKAGQEAEFGFLGIQVDPLAADTADGPTAGVRIGQIVRSTPATSSGLRLNDVITQIDSQPVYDPDDFLRQIGVRAPAEEVQLAIRREDPLLGRQRQLTLSLTLSKKYVAQSRPAIVTAERAEWRGLRRGLLHRDSGPAAASGPDRSRRLCRHRGRPCGLARLAGGNAAEHVRVACRAGAGAHTASVPARCREVLRRGDGPRVHGKRPFDTGRFESCDGGRPADELPLPVSPSSPQ